MSKFWTKKCKTGKPGSNFMYLPIFEKFFLVSHVFMSILMQVSAQNYNQSILTAQKNLIIESLCEIYPLLEGNTKEFNLSIP